MEITKRFASGLSLVSQYFARFRPNPDSPVNLSSTRCITGLLGSLLLLLSLLLWLLINSGRQQQLQAVDRYGATITRMTASQLAVPMNAENRIALQAMLTEITQYDTIEQAVIHDLDSRIVVQSGNPGISDGTRKEYTRAITLDETLLGSFTLSLNSGIGRSGGFYMGLFGLLLLLLTVAMATVLIAISRSKARDHCRQTHRDAGKHNQDQSGAAIPAARHFDNAIVPHRAVVILQLDTIDTLFRQLNSEARQQELARLENTLQKILTFHSGQLVALGERVIIAGFDNPDKDEAVFQALCCAWLVQQTSQKQQWLLQITALISTACDRVSLADLSVIRCLCRRENKRPLLLITDRLLNDVNLSKRLLCRKTDKHTNNGISHVEGFANNYQQLLNRQLSYLQ